MTTKLEPIPGLKCPNCDQEQCIQRWVFPSRERFCMACHEYFAVEPQYEPSGINVTPEELEAVKTARSLSGMWDSRGQPLGDPAAEVYRLAQHYNVPDGWPLDVRTGEFLRPMEGGQG